MFLSWCTVLSMIKTPAIVLAAMTLVLTPISAYADDGTTTQDYSDWVNTEIVGVIDCAHGKLTQTSTTTTSKFLGMDADGVTPLYGPVVVTAVVTEVVGVTYGPGADCPNKSVPVQVVYNTATPGNWASNPAVENPKKADPAKSAAAAEVASGKGSISKIGLASMPKLGIN